MGSSNKWGAVNFSEVNRNFGEFGEASPTNLWDEWTAFSWIHFFPWNVASQGDLLLIFVNNSSNNDFFFFFFFLENSYKYFEKEILNEIFTSRESSFFVSVTRKKANIFTQAFLQFKNFVLLFKWP